jgi:hypothetical protein
MILIRGVFDDWDSFKGALLTLKQTRGAGYTAYGPVDLREVEDLMPAKSSYVRGWATFGAAVGLATFFIMCVTTSLIYSLVVGGKPPVSNVPYVIPTYEGTILVGAICAFVAGLIYAYVGPRPLPEGYDNRFSGDAFGIEVTCDPPEREAMSDLMKKAGAVEVYEL